MGNFACSLLRSPKMKSSKAARVIFPTGEVRQYSESTKAAELMLETPNFFLVNSRSLHMGKRFSALGADEDLEYGQVYIMFPMKRLNSMVTGGDMAVLFMAANSAAKRISGGGVRILPENNGENVRGDSPAPETEEERRGSKLNLEEIEGLSVQEFKYRLSVCRSRKPMLETIREEPIRGR